MDKIRMDKTRMAQTLDRLAAQAAAAGNKLDITAVLDAFAGASVTPEEMEEVYSRLEKRGIELRAEDEAAKPEDDSLLLDEDKDGELSDSVSAVREDFRWKYGTVDGDDGKDDGYDAYGGSDFSQEEEAAGEYAQEGILEEVSSADPIREYLKEIGSIPLLSPDARSLLHSYPFQGNIRELKNIVERACVLCDGGCIPGRDLQNALYPRDLEPEEVSRPSSPLPAASEPERLLQALESCGGNRTKAARLLGMDRSTLWRKLQKYHLS